MTRFTWTYRQFVGGNAALDLVNTVIYPTDPAQRFDRLVDATELDRWIDKGIDLGTLPATLEGGRMREADRAAAIRLRDAVDAALRPIGQDEAVDGGAFAELLSLAGEAVRDVRLAHNGTAFRIEANARVGRGRHFLAHVAMSALSLAMSDELDRLKICPACFWLFIDRSRNRKRLWCDMETCGNRAKAQRHYARLRARRPAGQARRQRSATR